MYDIVIRNGTVVDGTGKEKYLADVAVKDGKIAKIGKMKWTRGKKEIDAAGKVVSPGFIDMHNHSDSYWRLFLEPKLPSLVYQGVTTIVGGNCGASIAPLSSGKIIESVQKWADIKEVNVNWLSMREFREEMEKRKMGLNFATLVGHGTLRRGIIGDDMRRLADNELELFKNILEKSLEAGALGFSAGLAYSHEREAKWDELEAMLEVLKRHNKIFSLHLRDEGKDILSSLDEAIDLAGQTGVSLQISHFKVMGEKNWPLAEQALQKIEEAQKAGIDVNFDVYPYTETGSVLYVYLPAWAAEGGKRMLLRRLKEKHLREKIVSEMKDIHEYPYEKAIVAISSLDKNLPERRISKIAEARGISAEEVVVDLLVASEGRVITLLECLDEENVRKAIAHPLSIIASDGSGYDINHKDTGEIVHPRCFGTFPRVLGKYVREEKLLTLEEAVKKMTSMPAKRLGFVDRGILQNNFEADIVVFDPEKIIDKSTIEDPYQYAEGVSEVVVNGKLVLEEGKMTGEMAGRFLAS
ncbi:MAG TPA: D-aminoacylase [Candidatus Saccharimonadales bacterium]|nr:D-aminoacylase [Candidatus Saccharimonadales bacterium]